jgi:hypothetical protein
MLAAFPMIPREITLSDGVVEEPGFFGCRIP